jgi:glucose/mannose transport system substrate-binding protein
VGTAASRLRRARKSLEELLSGAVENTADESSGSTRIFHWWATEEERSALEAMLDVHRRTSPRAPIVGTPLAGVSTAKRHLNTRILWNQPPDTFQASVGRDLLDWVRLNRRDDASGQLKPLDDLCAREAWNHAFPDVLLDAVSFGGHVYAVPINIHRTNTLFFQRRLFTENALAVPRSLGEFMSVAEELRRSGVVPLTLGVREGWPLTLLAFENLMVAIAGADYYVDFFSGQRSANDPALRETLETLKRVLTYVNEDAALLTWNQAVDRMLDGQSAMTVMGDWTRGYLAARGASVSSEHAPGASPDAEEIGQTPAFGTDDVFVFSSDSFPLAAEGHKRDTLDLLRTFGSVEGQIAFNLRKGSIPARIDTDVSRFDPVARRTMLDFRTRRHLPTLTSIAPREFMSVLDTAMARFATSRDVDEVTRVIRNHYATLRS